MYVVVQNDRQIIHYNKYVTQNNARGSFKKKRYKTDWMNLLMIYFRHNLIDVLFALPYVSNLSVDFY